MEEVLEVSNAPHSHPANLEKSLQNLANQSMLEEFQHNHF
jgi:hypothetical protein